MLGSFQIMFKWIPVGTDFVFLKKKLLNGILPVRVLDKAFPPQP